MSPGVHFWLADQTSHRVHVDLALQHLKQPRTNVGLQLEGTLQQTCVLHQYQRGSLAQMWVTLALAA